jgi:alginate O-acetyltransferase complex protein AlgI
VLSIWIGVLYYAVQLYCDFSGYTDMAIAVAGLLGYEVALNFDFPLLARNVSDFWRRWHISFSSWLRDYLYIPLGGSRGTESRIYVNLMLTMLLSGLWHGAGWTFVMWGALNGLGLCVERAYSKLQGVPSIVSRVVGWIGWPLTFFWFALTLVFFRAQDFGDAFTVSQGLVIASTTSTEALNPLYGLWFAPLFVAHWLAWRFEPTDWVRRLPTPLFAVLLGIAAVVAVSFVRLEYRPFIYFQF